jgi:hypothetical protein
MSRWESIIVALLALVALLGTLYCIEALTLTTPVSVTTTVVESEGNTVFLPVDGDLIMVGVEHRIEPGTEVLYTEYVGIVSGLVHKVTIKEA